MWKKWIISSSSPADLLKGQPREVTEFKLLDSLKSLQTQYAGEIAAVTLDRVYQRSGLLPGRRQG